MENITIFDTSFARSLVLDEFQSVLSLEKALNAVASEYACVTEETIKQYSETHPDSYQFIISISSLRNYLQKKNYKIHKDAPFLTKELKISEYTSLCEKSKELSETDTSDSSIAPSNCTADNDLLQNNVLITEYRNFYSSNKVLKQMNVRCSKNIWERFNALCEELSFFEKSHLLGYVLKKGLDSIKKD
ncbi:MAG: hypothetical protein KTQ14_11015 [Fusobacteriaceae bacterium]|nr:hypothetical protein [Fusobacteriaceae bacterium]